MRTSRGFRVTIASILIGSFVAFFQLERRETTMPRTRVEILPLATTPLTSPPTPWTRPTNPARQLAREAESSLTRPPPCAAQITLRIGTVDPEFKLDRAALETALLDAANEWNSATDREWFRVSSTGGIAVNLLFDGRQAELEERTTAEAQLDSEVALLKRELDEEHQNISRLVQSFDQRKAYYEELVSGHNAAVSQARQKGSVSQETVAAFREDERRLGDLRREIDGSFERIKPTLDDFKERTAAKTASLNERIAKFKQRYPPLVIREAEHRKGTFVNEVNVYTFTDARSLHYTLLHELGHTLGLSHTSETGAIMSPVREEESAVYHLTKSDIDAALQLCEERK